MVRPYQQYFFKKVFQFDVENDESRTLYLNSKSYTFQANLSPQHIYSEDLNC